MYSHRIFPWPFFTSLFRFHILIDGHVLVLTEMKEPDNSPAKKPWETLSCVLLITWKCWHIHAHLVISYSLYLCRLKNGSKSSKFCYKMVCTSNCFNRLYRNNTQILHGNTMKYTCSSNPNIVCLNDEVFSETLVILYSYRPVTEKDWN